MLLRVGDHEIHYEQRGGQDGGTPVVTVHGFVISQVYMEELADALAGDRRVLSPDLPGFGRSSKPKEALDVDGLADALAAWMEGIGLARADLVGNSMGCQVAMALAERHPERARRLVLIGPTVEPDARTLGAQVKRLAVDAFRERPSLVALHVPDDLRAGPRRILQTARHALDDAIEERAPHVQAPALILRGEHDPLVSAAFARELALRMPNARVVEIPDAPHAANHYAPEETARLVRAFLDG